MRLACVRHAASVSPEPGSNSSFIADTSSTMTGFRLVLFCKLTETAHTVCCSVFHSSVVKVPDTHAYTCDFSCLQRNIDGPERAGSVLLSHEAALAVSSGLEGLTIVFGMETGVIPSALTTCHNSPSNRCVGCCSYSNTGRSWFIPSSPLPSSTHHEGLSGVALTTTPGGEALFPPPIPLLKEPYQVSLLLQRYRSEIYSRSCYLSERGVSTVAYVTTL